MEEESNAALLLCYVALAFATLTGGRRWPVDSGPSSSQRGLWGGSSDSGRQQLLSVDTKAYAVVCACCPDTSREVSGLIFVWRSAGWSWRLELERCKRKILLGWLELELELVAGVV